MPFPSAKHSILNSLLTPEFCCYNEPFSFLQVIFHHAHLILSFNALTLCSPLSPQSSQQLSLSGVLASLAWQTMVLFTLVQKMQQPLPQKLLTPFFASILNPWHSLRNKRNLNELLRIIKLKPIS